MRLKDIYLETATNGRGPSARMLVSLLVGIASTFIFNSSAALAVDEPTVSWTTANSTTFSGTAVIEATAAPATTGSATIKKWCVTKDGAAVTTNLAVNASSGSVDNGTFSSSTGCWSSGSYSMRNGKFAFDTTAWVDGSHTYQITVTDSSDRTATSTVLTINNANTGPTVSWTTANSTTFSGTAVIEATAAPATTGSATIKKWCVTKDGAAVTTNLAVNASSGSVDNGTFSSSTGCWSSGSYSMRNGKFAFDTTAWVDGSHTYQITVTDSSDRTATSTVLTINTDNPRPTITLIGVTAGASLSGLLALSLKVTMPSGVTNLTVTSYCYKIDGLACGGSSSGFNIDSSKLKNGSHSIAVSIIDSVGRTVALPEISFTTANPGAALIKIGRKFTSPWWSDKSVEIVVSVTSSESTQAKVMYGLSPKSLTRTNWLNSGGGSITGLKPNTKYYFSVVAIGLNGNSKPSSFFVISPKIPSKPRSTGFSGGSGGSSGQSSGYGTSVIGWRLDNALNALGLSRRNAVEASNCPNSTWLGIINTSNWIVVWQQGSTLYACKM